MDKKSMIPRLKLMRLKHRLTQRELAQLARIPLWKISKWEAGTRRPSIVEVAMVQIVFKNDLFVLDPSELEELRNRKCPNSLDING